MNKNEHDKLAYDKFMKWLKVELLKDDDYGEEFVKELKDNISGYSDVEDNGELLEQAKSANVISQSEFDYLWADFITGPLIITGVISTLLSDFNEDELPKSWINERLLEVESISRIITKKGQWSSKCGELKVVIDQSNTSIGIGVFEPNGYVRAERIGVY